MNVTFRTNADPNEPPLMQSTPTGTQHLGEDLGVEVFSEVGSEFDYNEYEPNVGPRERTPSPTESDIRTAARSKGSGKKSGRQQKRTEEVIAIPLNLNVYFIAYCMSRHSRSRRVKFVKARNLP